MSERQMMAAVFKGEGLLSVEKKDIPEIKNSDEVLIQVKTVSICGTDTGGLSVPPKFHFKPGVIIGHECCGTVVETGSDVTNVKVGDKVVVHPNLWCGKCYYCRTGRLNLCENFLHVGDSRDGAMAEYLNVPEKLVYRIKDDVPVQTACLAEPLACVLNATTSVKAHPGQNVVVFGAGPIGMIFTMLYKASGADVFVVDISEKRRQFALEAGADFVLNPETEDVGKIIKEKTGTGADIAVDAVGFLSDQAIKTVKKGGDVVLFGINEAVDVKLNQAPVVFGEFNIHGKFIAKGTFPLAVKLIEDKKIPIEKLVSHVFPLESAAEGIDVAMRGDGIKVIIEVAGA